MNEYNLKQESRKYSEENVLESILNSQRMILNDYTKKDVMAYLSKRNHTEEVARNIANLAMKLHTKSQIRNESKTLLGGIVLSLIGLGITLATYQYAQAHGGGAYVVTYGIIIYGIFISLKSLADLYDIKAKEVRWRQI
jgi:hypothetical protein